MFRFIALAGLIWAAASPGAVVAGGSAHSSRAVCGRSPGEMQCYASVETQTSGAIAPDSAPAGYSAAQLRAAYGVTRSGSQTVAVVDAYGDPHVKSDLDTYSRAFNLPVLPS